MPSNSSAATPRLPACITPGIVLDQRYLIEGELGSGGLGVVYKGRHLALDAPVAIKLLRPEYAYQDDLVTRLREEARLGARLRSDHVVRVLDLGEWDAGTTYLVFEYVEGHDLETELARRGRLPIGVAVGHTLDICAALSEAHSRGVVHRDIKPENLLIEQLDDGRTRLKVADFGAAVPMRRRGRSADLEPGGYVGTPWYMAPEQIVDSRVVDARADIWSLGVVLYEMLTDRLPFAGETPRQVHANIVQGAIVPPRAYRDDVPPFLEAILFKCLQRDVVRRYPDVGELVVDLLALAPGYAQDTAASVLRRLSAVQVVLEEPR